MLIWCFFPASVGRLSVYVCVFCWPLATSRPVDASERRWDGALPVACLHPPRNRWTFNTRRPSAVPGDSPPPPSLIRSQSDRENTRGDLWDGSLLTAARSVASWRGCWCSHTMPRVHFQLVQWEELVRASSVELAVCWPTSKGLMGHGFVTGESVWLFFCCFLEENV